VHFRAVHFRRARSSILGTNQQPAQDTTCAKKVILPTKVGLSPPIGVLQFPARKLYYISPILTSDLFSCLSIHTCQTHQHLTKIHIVD